MRTISGVFLAIGLAAIATASFSRMSLAQAAKPVDNTNQQQLTDAIKQWLPSVVSIEVRDESGKTVKTGTGFIASPDGRIVTSYHVIQGGHAVFVKLATGAFFEADGLVAMDVDADIAILKVPGNGLPVLAFADSDKVLIGQSVIAMGSPLGLGDSVSSGVVSAIGEDSGRKWFQATATVSPGSSGAPLVDSSGQVLGILTLKADGGRNPNFIVPSNSVKVLLAFAGSAVKPFDFGAKPPDSAVKPPDSGARPPDSAVKPPDSSVKPPDSGPSPRFKFAPGQAVYIAGNDAELKRKAGEQFAEDRQFKVVDAAGRADFIFAAVATSPSKNAQELALVVSPDDYSHYHQDVDALRKRALWSGTGFPGVLQSRMKSLVKKFEQEALPPPETKASHGLAGGVQ